MNDIHEISSLTSHQRQVVIQPNASMSPRLAVAAFTILMFSSALMTAWSVLHGLWFVLLYDLAMLITVGWSLNHCLRQNTYREVVSIDGYDVVIESGHGAPEQTWRFNKEWIRLGMRSPSSRHQQSRLVVGGKGTAIELGRCLTEEERHGLCARLNQLLDYPAGW